MMQQIQTGGPIAKGPLGGPLWAPKLHQGPYEAFRDLAFRGAPRKAPTGAPKGFRGANEAPMGAPKWGRYRGPQRVQGKPRAPYRGPQRVLKEFRGP